MISIKELRIGNHVLLDGERVSVESVLADGKVCVIAQTDLKFVYDKDIDPILITEELLDEWDFIEVGDVKGKAYDWFKIIDDTISIDIKILKEGIVNVDIWDNGINKGFMICQYLHELESFIYLTTKKELL